MPTDLREPEIIAFPQAQRERKGAASGYVLGTGAFVVFGLIIPLVVLAYGRVSTTSLLTAATATWAAGRLSQLIVRGEPMLFDFVFWLYVYVFLGIAATAQVALNTFPSTMPAINGAYLEPAALVSVAGVLSWELGGIIANRLALTPRPEQLPSPPRSGALLVLGLCCAGYYILRVGIAPLVSSRDAVTAAKDAAWPNPTFAVLVAAAAVAPLLVGVHASIHQRRRERAVGAKPPMSVLLVLSLATLLLVSNPVGNPRILAGTVLLSFLPLVGCFSTQRRARATMLALIAIFILVFPYSDYYRRSAATTLRVRSPVQLFATKGDYDSFPQMANTVEYVSRFGYTRGAQGAGSLLFWMPRAVWTSKPLDTGVLLAQSKGYRFTNVSAPLWSEAFIDGGWGLLALVFVAAGYLMRRASIRAVHDLPVLGMGGISAGILGFYMLIVLRGSLLQAMCTFAALAACLYFVREKTAGPTRRRAADPTVAPIQKVSK